MTNSLSFKTPIGWLNIEEQDGKVWSLSHLPKRPSVSKEPSSLSKAPVLEEARRQVLQYFGGERALFDLPMANRGTTFQKSVWRAMRAIEAGQVMSYGEIAQQLGSASKARAVGTACGKNPFLLINPCHRVVASGGRLGGFSGGGPACKRQLLQHEGITLPL